MTAKFKPTVDAEITVGGAYIEPGRRSGRPLFRVMQNGIVFYLTPSEAEDLADALDEALTEYEEREVNP